MTTEFNYTCNTCGLSFGAPEYQREHMKTDWHRYNLKRRVADLPPIPSEVFAKKTLQIQQTQTQPPESRKQVTKKELRRQEKQAKREQNLADGVASMHINNHTRSESLSSVQFDAGEPSKEYISSSDSAYTSASETDVSDAGGDDVDVLLKQKLKGYVKIPNNVSFMDGVELKSTEENVNYLSNKYGLVLPEEDHIADLEGFVTYLNEKVGLGNCCLSCGYMGRSLAAVRAHMLDKRHVKIPWDTYDDRAEIIDFYDYSDDEDEGDDWEDIDGDEVDAEVDGDVDGDADDDLSDTMSYRGDTNQPFVDGYDLVLGNNGHVAGHRSLQRYYKQRYTAPIEKQGQKAVRLIDYRSPGVAARDADKMIKKGWAEQKKAERREVRGRKLQNHQKHFRDPLLQ